MDTENSPAASIIGCGMALDEGGKVGIVLMLGDNTDDGERTLATIVLDTEMGTQIVDKLNTLLAEALMAETAVETMGTEAATEYLHNWARRINSQLN